MTASWLSRNAFAICLRWKSFLKVSFKRTHVVKEGTSQWLTNRFLAPAKKKLRARPESVSPPLSLPPPPVSQADSTTRSASIFRSAATSLANSRPAAADPDPPFGVVSSAASGRGSGDF